MIIALVGMPGSGKTTVGKLLSLEGFEFVDIDEIIVKKTDMSINEIFALKGEDYFRKLESDVLREVLETDNRIVSTGGGIVKSDSNINVLRDKSYVVYLKTTPECLYDRVKNNTERPLLNTDDMKTKLFEMYSQRNNLYEKASHITVLTDNKIPENIVSEIKKEIYGNASS